MANPGFTSKEIKQILNLKCVGSVTDAVRPQLRKMLRLYLHDPVRFMQWALPTMMEVAMEMETELREKSSQSGSCHDGELSASELSLREDMLCGRIDRERVHPTTTRQPQRGNQAMRQQGNGST